MPMPEVTPTPALVVRPGDTLIVALAVRYLTPEQGAEIKERILARIPGLADVLIITQATAIAAYRPAAEEGQPDA